MGKEAGSVRIRAGGFWVVRSVCAVSVRSERRIDQMKIFLHVDGCGHAGFLRTVCCWGLACARERRGLQEGHGSAYSLHYCCTLGCLRSPGPVVLRLSMWVFGSSGEIGITEYRPSIQYCRGRQGQKVGKATLQLAVKLPPPMQETV